MVYGVRKVYRSWLWLVASSAVLAVGVWAYCYELGLPALGFHWTSMGVVYSVVPGGAAERAGIRVGDRFWLGGARVEDVAAFNRVLHELRVGKAVEVEVERGQEVEALTLVPMRNTLLLEGWVVDYLVGLVCWLGGWLAYRALGDVPLSRANRAFMLDMALLFFTLRPSPAHFRAIEYLCFGAAPALFIRFFLTFAGENATAIWRWSLIGGVPGVVAGVINAVQALTSVHPPVNWPYLTLTGSMVWGTLAWVTWLIRVRGAAGRVHERAIDSAIKVLIMIAPWFALMVYDILTVSGRGTTMALHLSAVGFPLALSALIVEQQYPSLFERIVEELMLQIPLQVIVQVVYWLSIISTGLLLDIRSSWESLISTSVVLVGITLMIPRLYTGLKGLYTSALGGSGG